MNKFIVLIAGLVAFVAVAQLAQANTTGGLTNEIPQGEEIDDELEGGFMDSVAKKVVGVSHKDEWGRDILDEDKGLSEFAHSRTQKCKKVKNEQQCETCCKGDDKAYTFKFWSNVLKSAGGCTCFDRDNSYARNI